MNACEGFLKLVIHAVSPDDVYTAESPLEVSEAIRITRIPSPIERVMMPDFSSKPSREIR